MIVTVRCEMQGNKLININDRSVYNCHLGSTFMRPLRIILLRQVRVELLMISLRDSILLYSFRL